MKPEPITNETAATLPVGSGNWLGTEEQCQIKALREEAALCRNETATDVAELLDDAANTIEKLLKEIDLRAEPSPFGTIAARLNFWKQRCDELHEINQQEMDDICNALRRWWATDADCRKMEQVIRSALGEETRAPVGCCEHGIESYAPCTDCAAQPNEKS